LNLNQSMVSERRKLNSVHVKKLVEKSNFKNYKMGQEIDESPSTSGEKSVKDKTAGDKRIGSFGDYSIQ
jgi:hypothetical protein